jgi:hypothetical protein
MTCDRLDRSALEMLLRDTVRTAEDPADLGLALVGIGLGLLTPAGTAPSVDHRFLRAFAATRLLRAGPAETDHGSGLRDDADGPHLRLVRNDPQKLP